MDIERAPLVKRATRLTLVAGLTQLRIEAVDSLSKDTSAGSLTHTSRTTEEVGVSKLTSLDSVLQMVSLIQWNILKITE